MARRAWLCWLTAVVLAIATPRAADDRREVVLGNGMRVILLPHRANPMIAASVVVGAGVMHEPQGMNGASHFLEHLLFDGTTTRTQRQLYDEVDRYGAYNNATTREDHTLFQLLIQKEFVEAGFAIQSDMLFRSTIPAELFEKERGIVLEELAKDKSDPAYAADATFRAFAFAATPLARPVLGTEASLGAMKRDDVVAYYKARYVPSNMTLVVMGDFEPERILPAIQATYGAAPKGEAPAASRAAWPGAPRLRLMRKPLAGGQVFVHAAFPLPIPVHDSRFAAVKLLLDAASVGDDAPLSAVLEGGAKPMVLSQGAGVSPRAGTWSTVEFTARVAEGADPRTVLDAFARQMRRCGPGSAAWGRLPLVRAQRRSEAVLEADQIHYVAMMRSAYVAGSPKEWLARQLESPDDPSTKELEAAAALLESGLDGLRAAIQGAGPEEDVLAWNPPPVESERVAPAGARRIVTRTLGNGAEVVVDANGDSQVFAVHLLFRARSASEPAGKEGIADFLHRLYLKGTAFRDAGAMSARLQEIGARLKTHDDPSVPFDDYYTTPEFSFVRFEIPAERWRDGVSLVAEMIRLPRFDEAAIEAVRKTMLDLQKRRSGSPREIASALLDKALDPEGPFSKSVLGTPESIASITRDDLVAFHAAYAGGAHLIATAVGPADAEAVASALEAALSPLPNGTPPPPRKSPPETASAREVSATLGKDQAYLALGRVFEAPVDDRPALAVAGALLSDRLAFHLREEKGLAYSIGASCRTFGPAYRFDATMGTRQANVDVALAGLREGIAAFVNADPDPAAVERAANALRGRLLMRRLTRINQAYFAGIDRLEGRSAGGDLDRLDALRRVTAADVKRVARRWIDPAAMVTVTVR